MASPSPEASEIRRRGRQRLIGAVAIALLLIVFVPMLLDSEPRRAHDEPKLDIPPKDKAPPLPAPTGTPEAKAPAVAPAAPPATASTPASEPADAKAPPPSVAMVEPKVVEPKAAEFKPPPPAKAPAATTAKAPVAMPAKMEGFAVQVGAFGDEAKLQQVRDKLAAAKITTYTEPSGNLTRLRVGPFPTREQAEKSATTVRRTVPEAKVVPLP
jgi:DedD protein